jgi:transcriptional regulator with XRE-family HTH domain
MESWGKVDSEKLGLILGDRIRELRSELGYTQQDVADKVAMYGIDVGQSQIGHIEKGRKLPSVTLLLAVAELLGTSADYLLGRSHSSLSPAELEEEIRTGGVGGRLGEVWRHLPAELQTQVFQFAEALLAMQKHKQARQDTARDSQFLAALLDALERNMGHEALESVLDALAPSYPEFTTGDDFSTSAGGAGNDRRQGSFRSK